MRQLSPAAPCALLLLALAGLFCSEAAALVERAGSERLSARRATVEGEGRALCASPGLPEVPARFEERLRQGASLQKIGPRELFLLRAEPLPLRIASPLCEVDRAVPAVNFSPHAEMSFAAHPPRAPPAHPSA